MAIRNHLDVVLYVKDVLEQLLAGATDYESLCPHVWKLKHHRIEERRHTADHQCLRRARRLRRKP